MPYATNNKPFGPDKCSPTGWHTSIVEKQKMKRHLKLISAVVLAALLAACGSGSNETKVINLLPVQNGNVFRYIDPSGKMIINPQFKQASVFRNGLALVQTFGNKPLWGFISEDGNFTLKAAYKEATIFSEDLAWVVPENGAPQVINTHGEIKFKLPLAKSVRIFKNGMAAFSVQADSITQKWGFVDKNGVVKVEPQYSAVGNFSDGRCAVANSTGEWGYIDTEGKSVINCQYVGAKEFVNGKAIVMLGKQWGVIDKDGKYLISPQFSDMKADKDGFIIKQNNKWGWCNKKGSVEIEAQFSDAYPFNGNELAAIKSGDKFGYIDKKGKMIIEAQFDSALPFNGKIAWVMRGGKGGFIDKNAKYVINPQYNSISEDFKAYVLTGTSAYESVNTDYFDLDAIMTRLKKDITANTVAGLNFSTPISTVLKKYKKTEADFKKGSSENELITYERISNDATLDFFILGSPWTENYTGNLSFSYTLKPNYKHSGFSYRIKLTGKALGKEDIVLKTLETALSGYTKDEKHSNVNVTILKSKSQILIGLKESGIVIVAIYPITPENLQMIDQNYGDGTESDSIAVKTDSI